MKLRNLFILSLTAATLVACGGGNTGNGGNNNNGSNNGSDVGNNGNAVPFATSDPIEILDPPVELDDQEPGQGVEGPQAEDDVENQQPPVEDPVEPVAPQNPPQDDAANPDNGEQNGGEFDPCRLHPAMPICNPVDINFPLRGQVNPLPPSGNNNSDDEPAVEEEQAEQAGPSDEFARRRRECERIPDERLQRLCFQQLNADIIAAQQEEEANRAAVDDNEAAQRLGCDGEWVFERNANGIGGQVVCRPIEDPCAEFAEGSIDYIRCVADLAHNS